MANDGVQRVFKFRKFAPVPELESNNVETPHPLAPGISVHRSGAIYMDNAWQPFGVSEQFLDEADIYHERYFNNDHWSWMVGRALEGLESDPLMPLNLLDIGSGSGNTIAPLASHFPHAKLACNDISPQLLSILMRNAAQRANISPRISAYCFDLHKDFFAPETFDGILGGAMLHHMLDPIAALRNAVKWLKPGGWIALVEPLERGWLMHAIIYHTLLEELEDSEPEEVIWYFKAMILDIEERLGAPRQRPNTPDRDDKWFFSPTFVREMAKELGLSSWSLEPLGPGLFRNNIVATMAAAGVKSPPSQRMLEILDEFDAQIADGPIRRRLEADGILRFWK